MKPEVEEIETALEQYKSNNLSAEELAGKLIEIGYKILEMGG